MKIIVINSSFRKNGNTQRIIKKFMEAFYKIRNDIEAEEIDIAYSNLKFCRGCRVCFNNSEENCPCNDDLAEIRDKTAEADLLILCSPVYVEDVNGVMKNWIDRMAFNCHRPAFSGKYSYIITTSGVGSSSHSITTMKRALQTWGFRNIGAATFKMGALMENEKIESKYRGKIDEITRKIEKEIRGGSINKPDFISLLTFGIQKGFYLKDGKDTYDYRYWAEKGWLKKEAVYYRECKINPVKLMLAGVMGKIIERIVLR